MCRLPKEILDAYRLELVNWDAAEAEIAQAEEAFKAIGDESLHMPTVANVFVDEACALAEFLKPLLHGLRVVDVGAGIGRLDLVLAYIAQPELLVAVDLDPIYAPAYEKLQRIADKLGLQVQYVITDARALRQYFDIAIIATYSATDKLIEIGSEIALLAIDVYATPIERVELPPELLKAKKKKRRRRKRARRKK